MPRHSVGRRGIETVAGEELPGRALCNNASIEKQTALVGIFRTEGHIMAHHQNGGALGNQSAKNHRKGHFKFRIKALSGLVQQQNIRRCQKNFRQSCPLLLTAGNIIGMSVQKIPQTA